MESNKKKGGLVLNITSPPRGTAITPHSRPRQSSHTASISSTLSWDSPDMPVLTPSSTSSTTASPAAVDPIRRLAVKEMQILNIKQQISQLNSQLKIEEAEMKVLQKQVEKCLTNNFTQSHTPSKSTHNLSMSLSGTSTKLGTPTSSSLSRSNSRPDLSIDTQFNAENMNSNTHKNGNGNGNGAFWEAALQTPLKIISDLDTIISQEIQKHAQAPPRVHIAREHRPSRSASTSSGSNIDIDLLVTPESVPHLSTSVSSTSSGSTESLTDNIDQLVQIDTSQRFKPKTNKSKSKLGRSKSMGAHTIKGDTFGLVPRTNTSVKTNSTKEMNANSVINEFKEQLWNIYSDLKSIANGEEFSVSNSSNSSNNSRPNRRIDSNGRSTGNERSTLRNRHPHAAVHRDASVSTISSTNDSHNSHSSTERNRCFDNDAEPLIFF